jgi:UDP-N-acetylglucosamine--N-acetylmuramyl-(pentapeptide) pyrophosphoryl-undecaprenol N-acetylglucosamine transferase
MERALVERAGIAFRAVHTGKMRGANPIRLAKSTLNMMRGVQESRVILANVRPDVCFVTGGYVCAPMVLACGMRGVPVLIYLPDMAPGLMIRWMSKIARRVAVSFPEVAPSFGGVAPQGKAVVTGYPVRQELVDCARDRSAARAALAQQLQRPLFDDFPLVLVWGGSQGSRSINQATWSALVQVLPHGHVLHVVGERDWPLYEQQGVHMSEEMMRRYHPVAYLHNEMTLALAAADVSVARAGASTLGEFPIARLPSILVPLLSVNQNANAELLVKHGGALTVADEHLKEKLAPTLVSLLNDRPRRRAMETALQQLAQPDAALRIAQEIVALGLGA